MTGKLPAAGATRYPCTPSSNVWNRRWRWSSSWRAAHSRLRTAAKELLDLLRDSLAEALVRQWRTLKAGGESIPAESFRDQVDLVKREVDARGMDADAYIAVIRTMLIPKN